MRKSVVLILLLLTSVISVGAAVTALNSRDTANAKPVVVQTIPTPAYDLPAASDKKPVVGELWVDVNVEREKLGLSDLVLDQRLNNSAQDKCNDMVARDYFAHNTPDGQEPWVFIQKYDIGYNHAAENLAYGINDSQELVNGWMNSPEHRANIANTMYKKVGYAVCHSDSYQHLGSQYIVVQHFVDL